MALNGSSIFPQSNNFTTNYSWVDVADATGYILYEFWASHPNTGSTTYNLTPFASMSSLISTKNSGVLDFNTGTKSNTVAANYIDLDFDSTPFNLPRTIKGDAIIRLSASISEIDPGSGYQAIPTIKFRKWNGATETEIASCDGYILYCDTDATESWTLKCTIPQTHFKKGDMLRITIQFSSWVDSPGSYQLNVGFNPRDLGTTHMNAPTRMCCAVPFKMDL